MGVFIYFVMSTRSLSFDNLVCENSDIDGLLFLIDVEAALNYLGLRMVERLACEVKREDPADFLHLNLGTPGLDETDALVDFGLENLLRAAQEGIPVVPGFISGCLEEAVAHGLIDNRQLIEFQQRWLA